MSDKTMYWVMVLCSWAALILIGFAIGSIPWLWLRLVLFAVLLLFVAAVFGSARDKRKKDTDERI